MTMQQETRFKCDRCAIDINVALNEQPAQARARPPEGWMAMWIDNSTEPARHLCTTCTPLLRKFMGWPND